MAEVSKINGYVIKDVIARNSIQEISNILDKENENSVEKIYVNGEEQPINDKAVDITIPTKTSDLTNDSEYINLTMLNEGLSNKVNKIEGKGLSSNDYTDEDKNKLSLIDDKVTKESGKGLSTNDFTDTYKNQLDNLKIPTKTSELENDSGYLKEHQDISGKVDKEEGKGLSQNDFSDQYKSQLDNLNVPTKTSELENDSGYLSASRYTNTLVLITDFIEDSTFEDYPYKADIAIDGITGNDYANISFALSDVQSKNYAPICTTDNGKISIYAVEIPLSDITIPLIEVVKI